MSHLPGLATKIVQQQQQTPDRLTTDYTDGTDQADVAWSDGHKKHRRHKIRIWFFEPLVPFVAILTGIIRRITHP